MNRNWMPDVLRDLKKCAENHDFHLLAAKLEEARKMSQSLGKHKMKGKGDHKQQKKAGKSAQIIDFSVQRKIRRDQNADTQLKP